MTPYPFGFDGNPVDPASGECGNVALPGPGYRGDYTGGNVCYQAVTSMAFRAWNRGLASTEGAGSPYALWLYNGTRWYPDPTFPGTSACPGHKVLWAGKLDYWLVGGSQTLCRFDGSTFQWEELTVPPATIDHWVAEGLVTGGGAVNGAITTGACYAWNDCWFFGSGGAIVHWDGLLLTDTTPGLGQSPWLGGYFTDAVAEQGPSGNEFGFAVTGTGFQDGSSSGDALPAQPNGAPPPQLYSSQSGGPFSPTGFSPPGAGSSADPFTTDLAAVAYDAGGAGWVAGNQTPRESATTPVPAPLLSLDQSGSPANCLGYGASTFTSESGSPSPGGSFKWTSLAVLPSDASALAGANWNPATYGPDPNDATRQAAIVHAVCGQSPVTTSFVMPDPTMASQSTAPLVPANPGDTDSVSAIAASASNDAWAATSGGNLPTAGQYPIRPHLYQFTDGQMPNAPAGNDDESRPPTLFTVPPTYVQSPPTIVVIGPTTTTQTKPGTTKIRRVKPPIYSVKAQRPLRVGRRVILYVTFKVRYAVTIGVEALRGHTVVARSGLRTFRGRSGRLALVLDPARWPTSLKFVQPKSAKSADG